jgi:hypothetical protein
MKIFKSPDKEVFGTKRGPEEDFSSRGLSQAIILECCQKGEISGRWMNWGVRLWK